MKKNEIIEHIKKIGLIPVVRVETSELAIRAIDAIVKGGINILEIPMTVQGAVGVIEGVVKTHGDNVLVGVGTVLDPETARTCILAGAQFIISPSFNAETVALCRRYSVPVLPGALTPTEVINAWQAGADMVKIFPCSAVGGASYIKLLKGPLPQIELIPTGGILMDTAADFLKAGAAAVGIGTDLVDVKAIRDGNDDLITQRARAYVDIVKKVRSS
ncbi:MAG: bifunctional 4-hydroxy-2-oxoglutarate aldolase/2-dehydro-3-deoxy-phosphogluconate aldolase [Pyrinomonadaceae bacterium]